MKKLFGICVFIVFIQAGCSSEPAINQFSSSDSSLPDVLMPAAMNEDKGKYLAYIHSVQLDMPAEKVNDAFTKIISMCTGDTEYDCSVLNSSLNKGEYARSSVTMRLLPAGVQSMIDSASFDRCRSLQYLSFGRSSRSNYRYRKTLGHAYSV